MILNLALVVGFAPSADTQTAGPPRARALITAPVNESNRVTLSGNTRPEARDLANDRGVVADDMPMPHMLLQLRRPAAQEQALQTLIGELNDPRSPNFHHWIGAAQLGAQYGPADSDIAAVTSWLQQHGFTVNMVYANKMVVDFSGTAGQVSAAFRTAIHHLDVEGVARIANMSDPQIPAALAPALVGPVSLHNIPPKPLMRRVTPQYSPSGYTCGPGYAFPCQLVTPADLATIYNFNPLFSAGTSGQGQTIYLIEDTDLYSYNDWTTFRSTFGLSGYTSATLSTVHPGNCTDPGVNSDDGEAILDAEYASAAAPSAAIVMATCATTQTTFGGFIAIQNLVNGAFPPAIISLSYGSCEASNGSAANQAFSTAYQTGAAGGMSIFVSAGDGGAAGCDDPDSAKAARQGIAANGLGSSVYNVAVGGTDFSDTYSGTNSTYWNATNSSTYGSANSYIPEIPWNDSCGSQLYAAHYGFTTTYGSSGLCNSSAKSNDGLLNIVGGSGAPSSVWPKPSWQTGLLGNPADGARDLPDVSLFASDGSWGHFYAYCYSDPNNGGTSCTGAPVTWSGAGGTSFAAPIWAGIQALINQQAGGKQGLPNTRLYAIAAVEYGAGGSSMCMAGNGNAVGGTCIFYDVTQGDNDVPCRGGLHSSDNCYAPSGTYGVLSTSTSAYQPAYPAQTGWDFATGIGTVNVANLVLNWLGANGAGIATTTALSGAPNPSTPGQTVTFTARVTSGSGTPTGTVTFMDGATTLGNGTLSGGKASLGTAELASGTHMIAAYYSGDANFAGSTSAALTQTVDAAATTTALSGTPNPSTSGQTVTFTATVTSSSGIPSGSVSFADGATVIGSGTLVNGETSFSTASLSAGSHMITATYMASANFAASESVPVSETVDSGSVPPSGTAKYAWVSGKGTDAAGCSGPTNPCRTLQYVHDNIIAAGGEIDILDPAAYGAVTITKALSIVNIGAGSTASVLAVSGANAITINAGSSDAVILWGLDIEGLGSGQNGIQLNSGGTLKIVNCTVQYFTGNGIGISPNGGTTNVTIYNTVASSNSGSGIFLGPTGTAIVAALIDKATVADNAGDGIAIVNAGGGASATIAGSLAAGNASAGFEVFNAGSSMTLGRSVAGGNSTGIFINTGGTAYSYDNNTIGGNTNANVVGTLTVVATR